MIPTVTVFRFKFMIKGKSEVAPVHTVEAYGYVGVSVHWRGRSVLQIWLLYLGRKTITPTPFETITKKYVQ
jgi:hypothetical protein